MKFEFPVSRHGGSRCRIGISFQFQISLWGVCLFLVSSFSCLGASASERLFLWNEANAITASARTPENYLIAAQSYQNLIDKGICNGPVCYNLGTALLNASRYENAIEALSRAERYLGSRPDIQRNLDIAMARKAQRKEPYMPWYRIVLFWHFRLSSPTRTTIAVGAFSLFWLFLTLRVLGVRRWIKAPAILSFLVLVLFASSVATSWQQESSSKRFSLLLAPPVNTAVQPAMPNR